MTNTNVAGTKNIAGTNPELKPRGELKAFLMDAAVAGIQAALAAAQDAEECDFVDCSGSWDDEDIWQQLVIKGFKHEVENAEGDVVDTKADFEFRLEISAVELDAGW